MAAGPAIDTVLLFWNTGPSPVLAQATLWTDLGVPVFTFPPTQLDGLQKALSGQPSFLPLAPSPSGRGLVVLFGSRALLWTKSVAPV